MSARRGSSAAFDWVQRSRKKNEVSSFEACAAHIGIAASGAGWSPVPSYFAMPEDLSRNCPGVSPVARLKEYEKLEGEAKPIDPAITLMH